MRTKTVGLLAVLAFGAALSGGCGAKKELVKQEEQIPQTTAAKTATPADSAVTPSPNARGIAEQPVSEIPVKPAPAGTAPRAAAAEVKESPETIYFGFDSALLSEQAREALVKNADLLRKDGALKIRVEGNCDERGSDEYNLALGERRARAAMNYLVTMGIPAERLSFVSYGEERPADRGQGEESWARNRRDEFAVVGR
jgi:peptidoglycan-associated lipoprotein